MSTAIELFDANAFKGQRAAVFQQHTAPIESLADGIGQSYPIIGYRGKVWSMRYRGERKNIVRPDDGTPASAIEVIIVKAASVKSKSYYAAFDPNNEGEMPLCASMDGVTPDGGVRLQQASACALCPRNEWKTLPNGKKGRECADYKRAAVLLMPQVTQMLFGEPLMEPAFLRIPPASLQALAMLGEQMEAQGYPGSYEYVTRITFDPNEAHPKMIFKAIRPLGDAEAKIVLDMRQEPQCNRIVSGESSHGPRQLPIVTAAPAITGPVNHSTLEATGNAAAVTSTPVGVGSFATHTVFAPPVIDATVAPPASPGATKAPSPSTFVPPQNVQAASPPPSTSFVPNGHGTAPNGPPIRDAGEPTLADAELDARIAALMPPQ